MGKGLDFPSRQSGNGRKALPELPAPCQGSLRAASRVPCAPAVTPAVPPVTRQRGCASARAPSPAHPCPAPGAVPAGKSREQGPAAASPRAAPADSRLCLHEMEFYKIYRIRIPPLHIKPAAAPWCMETSGVGGNGAASARERLPKFRPPPAPPPEPGGDPGTKAGLGERGWRDGGEGERFQRRRAVDREGRQGAAHAALPRPHLAGLTKGPDGAARLRRFPSPGSAKFRGTERAAGTATFSLRRVWLCP